MRRSLVLTACVSLIGLTPAALGQGTPLNVADNPIDLAGNYLCPSSGGQFGSYVRANTDPSDHATFTQVVEVSGGMFAKNGTFTPFNGITKWPARLAVDLTGKTFQFEVDLNPANPAIPFENATFVAGAGSEIGSSTQSIAEIEISKTGPGFQFDWRSGAGGSTTIGTVTPGGSNPTPTQYRIRVSFGSQLSGSMATVVITPLNNISGPVSDIVVNNLPVAGPVTNAAFVAGFLPQDGVSTSRGAAVLTNFLTNAGPNHMWIMSPNPYRSTNPQSKPSAQTPMQYMLGFSNPTERVFAWQALISPPMGYVGMDFSFGLPVFDTVMLPPFNGTLDPSTYGFLYPNGVIRSGAYSILANPTGTNQSSFTANMTFGLQSYENWQMPSFIAVDPAGGPAPAITTLQGVGYTNIASVLRETNQVLTDNTRPGTSVLRVIQDSVNNPAVIHQGPIQIRFRAEDFGLGFAYNLGTGLARYPRAVVRPVSNPSIDAGVQQGDVDISNVIYPDGDNIFVANLTIGTPGTLDVPCGNYRVVTWAEDRVGLISTPSTAGNQSLGYAGATPPFEVRKFNSATVQVSVPGFSGSAPDSIHSSPPQFQRWVTITVGGAPGSSGSMSPVTYEKLILLDPSGNGVISLTAADGLPCPGPTMYVSVKDQQHSLRKTVQLTLTPNTSDYTASMSLTLGDLNNDNRVSIADFGIFLANYGIIYSQNDVTGTTFTTHCDLSGNRRVWFEDYLFIQNNNNAAGDQLVGGFTPRFKSSMAGEESNRILVKNLLAMGIKEAARYDMNRDGWVTWSEMQQVLALKNARKW
ncbi:MAG TPA: hypothetical protein VG820_04050 [Fimbriimonadaceae bacterium]|nr:hypothetical protein [Fimbriimonadaceae bacterium]